MIVESCAKTWPVCHRSFVDWLAGLVDSLDISHIVIVRGGPRGRGTPSGPLEPAAGTHLRFDWFKAGTSGLRRRESVEMSRVDDGPVLERIAKRPRARERRVSSRLASRPTTARQTTSGTDPRPDTGQVLD